jgi:polyisoprenoid-binding protein YceI
MNKALITVAIASLALASCGEVTTPENQPENNSEAVVKTSTKSKVDFSLPDGIYALNKIAPSINWVAKKVTGDGHSGSIGIKDGKFKVEEGALSSGIINFDMASFAVTDIEDAEQAANFNGHLLSPDFFDIEQYPNTSMNISAISGENGVLQASTSLNLHGTAVDYKVPVTITKVENEGIESYEFSGQFFINRTLHGITYGSGSFFDNLGDRTIKDEVLLQFTFTAVAI